MAYNDEPLRISCEGCPDEGCEDCLVDFILAERDARVVRLQADPEAGRHAIGALEPDLERALTTLIGAGLQPELLAVRRSDGIQRAS
jgi:hypothetical protein